MLKSIIVVLLLSVVCFGQSGYITADSIVSPWIIYSGEAVPEEITPVLIDEVWSKDEHSTAERIKKFRKEIMRSLTLRALRNNKKFIESEARRLEKSEK